MICNYCMFFNDNSTRRNIYEEEKETKFTAFCIFVDKDVTEETKACSFFRRTERFYCNKEETFIHLFICNIRKKTANECSKGCEQRKEIEKFFAPRKSLLRKYN